MSSGSCTYVALSVDVRDICGHARTPDDIVQRELADSGVELQEEGERLADTTRGTKDGDFGSLEAHSQVSQCHCW